MDKLSSSVCLTFIILLALALAENIKKPNIILIVTDDQDVVLHGLIPMTETRKHLGAKGVTFLNAFSSSPICCPSRASILSGQYAHNHATTNNSASGGCYGSFWQEKVEPRALPVQLEKQGYETFFAGKYLNEYYNKSVPPGWKKFYGLHGNSRYYNYTLTENGEVVGYGDVYLTDLLNSKTVNFLAERNSSKPFFVMVAPPAPHAPYTAAPRHENAFDGVKAPRTPNFNAMSGILDKHWLLTMEPKLPQSVIDIIDGYYRKRWQSLLAVDDLVKNIVQYLETNNLIDETYIIFTSDHGYHIGQFSQAYDKRQPYETDIRVPLIIRGPNINPKTVAGAPTVLIDLFPTILEWAGANMTSFEDGQSFHKVITSNDLGNNFKTEVYNRQILIEYWGEGSRNTYNPQCPWKKSDNLFGCTIDADCHCQDSWNNTYSCVRHFAFKTDMLYCEFKDNENFVEAYDLYEDPYQMENLGYKLLPSSRALYSLMLQHLKECIGEMCRAPHAMKISE